MGGQGSDGMCKGSAVEDSEQERLARVAERRARNVERYRREYGDLTDEEVIADLIPTTDEAMAPVVMMARLIAAIGNLQKALRRVEYLTWGLIALTCALLVVSAVLLIRA